ncbi:MAG: hypothetical protein ACI9MR_001000, partial [Myxococcota bacterium]
MLMTPKIWPLIPALLVLGTASACGTGNYHQAPPVYTPAHTDASYDVYDAPTWVEDETLESVDYFYEPLAAYGTWDVHPVYGWLWRPAGRYAGPYVEGYWVHSDAGYVWRSQD